MSLRTLGACVLVVTLVACGGGGGVGGTGGSGGGGGVIPTPTPIPSLTTASGRVVNDANGSPMAGVKVALRPWAACATPTPTTITCPTALPAPQATTAADGSFTLSNAPNGHYFLTIGDDTPGSNVTTVHDQVTFTGGAVALQAPSMPPIPQVTPATWETNGSYRIQTLDAATEAPCFTEFNLKRTSFSLPTVVADEWLLENARGIQQNHSGSSPSSPPWPGNANGGLADTGDFLGGGSNCSQLVDPAFGNAANPSRKLQTTWYGGYYVSTVYGVQEEMPDPATVASAVGVVWP